MSEETPAILAESASSGEPVSDLGGALRTAREKLGLEIEEVARKLCLSPRQLVALEADDIRALPSPAFTRGFIRNYARLLNLDPNPLLAVYRDMLPQNLEGTAIRLHSEDIPIKPDRKAWMSYLLASVLIGIAGGLWFAYMEWSERRPAPVVVAPAAKPEPVKPAPVPPALAPAPAVETVPPPAMEMPTEQTVNAQEPLPPAPALPAKKQLNLTFTQQSWVRVLDRDGVEIFHNTRPAGSTELVEGLPPFKVEIGNAAGVQLSYNGQPVDLVPHAKANVARLTVE